VAVWDFVSTARFLSGLGIGIGSICAFWLICRRVPSVGLTTVTLSLPFGLGSVTYAISHQERIAAWQLYVQLKTRKAALPFDPQHDLIIEILDSLYELVDITRDLISNMPPRHANGLGVSDLMLRVLNDGLRPFLTRWQANFRRWWDFAAQETSAHNDSPQTIQRRYPDFDRLTEELMDMNRQLDEYAQDLLAIARAEPKLFRRRTRPEPTPPSENTMVGS
jgi:hypothetical protein